MDEKEEEEEKGKGKGKKMEMKKREKRRRGQDKLSSHKNLNNLFNLSEEMYCTAWLPLMSTIAISQQKHGNETQIYFISPAGDEAETLIRGGKNGAESTFVDFSGSWDEDYWGYGLAEVLQGHQGPTGLIGSPQLLFLPILHPNFSREAVDASSLKVFKAWLGGAWINLVEGVFQTMTGGLD
ncbi:hypothetical protein WISP_47468 [Willisornis vidua]|uniref:Uncharacterized protein n=1 Tax=Willisornis vidua TaxID=1566151 RepID=A0ABQ9DFI5_9PASS|nr:hypothetical protein WISP_47468 [Willisornis vidua]